MDSYPTNSESLYKERDAIIIQRYKEGWGYQKIAGYIGIPINSVKARINTLVKYKRLERRRAYIRKP